MRKRRVLRRGEVDELYRKLAAIGAMNLPLPKGPVPTRIPRRGGRMRCRTAHRSPGGLSDSALLLALGGRRLLRLGAGRAHGLRRLSGTP